MENIKTIHRALLMLKIALIFLVCVTAWFLQGCVSESSHYGPGAGHFKTVIVDAGHGGHDRGARAIYGFPEKMVALDTAKRLAMILRQNDFHVIETRAGDNFVSLSRRTAIANYTKNAIFISIHYNWSRRRGARGIEIYYCNTRSKRLAANILHKTLRAYGTENRGIKARGFYVLRNNRRPAVLCELGFISNSNDNNYVQNSAYRQRIAEQVAAGIIDEQNGRVP